MLKHKYTSVLGGVVVAMMLLITVLFMMGERLGIAAVGRELPYVEKLFNTEQVHSLDIVIDEADWQNMLDNAINKEYVNCNLVIDGEAFRNVAIRTKGNSSLSSIVSSTSDRYSFKVEFDHYDNSSTYYGLDKLALNNIAQDNTYLKDYLSYQLMNAFSADAPLCSFIYLTVNGEDWGLYLAVEGIEEAFATRNYGNDYGEIYKPDSMDMAGGMAARQENDQAAPNMPEEGGFSEGEVPSEEELAQMVEQFREQFANRDNGEAASRGAMGGMGGRGTDVALVYSDDDPASYANIFDNAIFNPTEADQKRLIASLKQLNAGENLAEVVNIEEVLRYFVVHNFVLNFDSYTGSMTHNYYLYEEDGQLAMIAWDYNLAFGAFAMGGMGGGSSSGTDLVNFPIDTPVSGTTLADRPLLGQLLADEEYAAQYHALFSQFVTEIFVSGAFIQLFDDAVALISPYVENDPTAFCTYEEFQSGAANLREFCLLRAESISGQLDGTIPSTTAGQDADSSNFVDASAIDMSTMGSNMSSFGGGRGGMRWQQMITQEEDSGAATEAAPPATTEGTPEDTADTPQLSPPSLGIGSVGGITVATAEETPAAPQAGEPPEGMTRPEQGGEGGPPANWDGTMPEGMTPPEGMPEGMQPPEAGQPPTTAAETPPSAAEAAPAASEQQPATEDPQAEQADPDAGEPDADDLANEAEPDQAADAAGAENFANRPEGMGGQMPQPGGADAASNTAANSSQSILYLAVSLVVLLAGLLIAWRFRV